MDVTFLLGSLMWFGSGFQLPTFVHPGQVKTSLVSLEASVSLWKLNQDLGVTKPFLFFFKFWISANPSSLPPAFIPSTRSQRVLATPHFTLFLAVAAFQRSPSLVHIWSGLPLYSHHHSCSGVTFGDGVSPAGGSGPKELGTREGSWLFLSC